MLLCIRQPELNRSVCPFARTHRTFGAPVLSGFRWAAEHECDCKHFEGDVPLNLTHRDLNSGVYPTYFCGEYAGDIPLPEPRHACRRCLSIILNLRDCKPVARGALCT